MSLQIMRLYDIQNHLSFSNEVSNKNSNKENNDQNILCKHCLRTSSNGIRCMGICVADNDY